MEQNNMDKNNDFSAPQNEPYSPNTTSGDFSNIINNFDVNKLVSILNKLNKNASAESIILKKNDTRIDVLNFLKDFLPQDKKVIIDQVIDAFSEKSNPPDK